MPEIDVKTLKECICYNQETGVFTWRERPLYHFKTSNRHKGFNTIHAGKLVKGTNNNGYIKISLFDVSYMAHRLAWLYVNGEMPKGQIDHINGNKKDNRIANLRDVDSQANCMNLSLRSYNTSGVCGVSWDKRKKRWAVRINVNGKPKRFGTFDDIELAELVANEAYSLAGYHENHGRKPNLIGQ